MTKTERPCFPVLEFRAWKLSGIWCLEFGILIPGSVIRRREGGVRFSNCGAKSFVVQR
jgi:hypothetical protein